MPYKLPSCPTCNTEVHRETSVGGFIHYACNNDLCDHFPATAYHPTEAEARTEWLAIIAANTPKEGLSPDCPAT